MTLLGGPSVYPAWRLSISPVFAPLGARPIPKRARKNPFPRLRGKVAEGRKGGIKTQDLSRLAGPVFTPLGEASICTAWWAQCLRRLARPVFAPLGRPSIYPAWRAQYLPRLAGPVFTPLDGPSVYAAWWTQCLRRLVDPVFTPLGGYAPAICTISRRPPSPFCRRICAPSSSLILPPGGMAVLPCTS